MLIQEAEMGKVISLRLTTEEPGEIGIYHVLFYSLSARRSALAHCFVGGAGPRPDGSPSQACKADSACQHQGGAAESAMRRSSACNVKQYQLAGRREK